MLETGRIHESRVENLLTLKDLGLPGSGQAFYEKLIALQQVLKSKMDIPEELNRNFVTDLLSRGEPLISQMLPYIDEEDFQKMVVNVCQLFLQYVPERQKEIEGILNLRGQLHHGMDVQSFQKEHEEISGELLSLILENVYRPYYLALAERLPDYDLNHWKKNYCPVCGEKASLASLDEESGQRVLWCSFCTTGWPFPRLACPECGNSDHKELKYFYLEDDRSFQVHTCGKCKGYIKTVRRGLIKPEHLTLANAQTVCLDLLAQREGYHRR